MTGCPGVGRTLSPNWKLCDEKQGSSVERIFDEFFAKKQNTFSQCLKSQCTKKNSFTIFTFLNITVDRVKRVLNVLKKYVMAAGNIILCLRLWRLALWFQHAWSPWWPCPTVQARSAYHYFFDLLVFRLSAQSNARSAPQGHPEWKTMTFYFFQSYWDRIDIQPYISLKGAASWVDLHPSCSDDRSKSSEHPYSHMDTKLYRKQIFPLWWELLGFTLSMTFIRNLQQCQLYLPCCTSPP